jgi:RNA recognition motif-containing protein
MNIYIGNIARESSEEEIRKLFEEFGKVDSVVLIKDNQTNMLKGFGFIEMPAQEEAENAIKSLNGQLFNNRPLTVNVAKPKKEFGGNRGGGHRGGGKNFGGNRR